MEAFARGRGGGVAEGRGGKEEGRGETDGVWAVVEGRGGGVSVEGIYFLFFYGGF